jgi:putative ubiquitin-RnfH superfamily antitoxin RatB of RatAB toxin-antitoxin module
MPEAMLSISVVYALPERQEVVKLSVPAGTSVAQAVSLSKLSLRFPRIEAEPLRCAIFGRAVQADHIVSDGDRIELLRPLLIDPKEHRRQAAARTRGSKL